MIALITGGTKGIGLSITKTLLSSGYQCVITARSCNKEIENLISQSDSKLDFIACDNSKKSERDNLITQLIAKVGRVDLLINNAGVAPKTRKDMLDIDENDYDYVMDINLKGAFFLTQAVSKYMIPLKSGRIINISSISAETVSVNRAEYCLSKAGVAMMTKLFATRLAEFNIGVFEIRPGIIETDMTEGVKTKYIEMISNGLTPIKRMGQPQDIASCVMAIANGYLDFCTGTVINADGGYNIRRL